MRAHLVKALAAEIYVVGLVGFFALCGFYSIPPSAVAPGGVTRVVMRAPGEPFFNSPLLACLERDAAATVACLVEQVESRPRRHALLEIPFLPWVHRAAMDGTERS
jgi:hypothetical protein